MDPKEISKIEETIKENINEETQQSIAQLKEQIERETEAAITRINNVYATMINTLRKLELTDATIFEFFQKTNGNIRVYEFKNEFVNSVEVHIGGRPVSDYRNSVQLQENSKYKIILMAIKE